MDVYVYYQCTKAKPKGAWEIIFSHGVRTCGTPYLSWLVRCRGLMTLVLIKLDDLTCGVV